MVTVRKWDNPYKIHSQGFTYTCYCLIHVIHYFIDTYTLYAPLLSSRNSVIHRFFLLPLWNPELKNLTRYSYTEIIVEVDLDWMEQMKAEKLCSSQPLSWALFLSGLATWYIWVDPVLILSNHLFCWTKLELMCIYYNIYPGPI